MPLVVEPSQCDTRLDALLRASYPTSSRTYFQALIRDGFVLVNGAPARKSAKLAPGDEIDVQFVLTPELDLQPEAIPLDILYEDDAFLAVNKPAGMCVHPGNGNRSGTFVNALLYYCQSLQGTDPLRPGIVHRLDKDTSGVLIAAKTAPMHRALSELFAARKVHKEYLALCVGTPSDCTIDAPIGRHPTHRTQMAVVPNGKEAITHIHVERSTGEWSLVRVRIETGRTHQIRVHLRHIGHPVVGDQLYGNERCNARLGATRQLLHCCNVAFQDPRTAEPRHLTATLPSDIIEALTRSHLW